MMYIVYLRPIYLYQNIFIGYIKNCFYIEYNIRKHYKEQQPEVK